MNQPTADTTSRGALVERVREIAREHLDAANPTLLDLPSADLEALRLVDDLGLDSVDLLTLAVEVEDAFHVTLDELDATLDRSEADSTKGSESGSEQQAEDAPGVVTVGDLVDLVWQKLGASA